MSEVIHSLKSLGRELGLGKGSLTINIKQKLSWECVTNRLSGKKIAVLAIGKIMEIKKRSGKHKLTIQYK